MLPCPHLDASRRATPAAVAGFGLIQAVVLLLLIASAVTAGALILQSRRAPDQARAQEATLRWADQAVTAFAAANARLPCPATTLEGDEDCSDGHDSGWLPLRTLAGASGTAPGVGPVRYAVYRGEGSDHLDLTRPQNAYQPRDAMGEIRVEAGQDDAGKDIEIPFEAVNGLDLCLAFGLAASASADAALAGTTDRDALPVNIAYGLAAAGPTRGSSDRFDGGNTTARLESPWRRSDAEYDDRVRTRSFASAAHAVGCRQVADGTVNIVPYNVATASVDALAASLTLHDSVAELQDNNIGNAEAAVRDAGIAQAMAAAALVLSAGHVVDTVTSNITAVGNLVRAIGTCIASLGATCWEVPLKASAIAMQVGSIISYGVAIGANVGNVTAAALALSAAVKARDRAKAAATPPASNLEEAKAKVCLAANGGWLEERRTVKTDADGNVVWKLDGEGKPMFDENGVQLYEYVIEHNVWQDGLKQQVTQAEEAHAELVLHTNSIERMRVQYFNDTNIRYRINESASFDLFDGRYKKWECYSHADGGEYNSACQHVGYKTVEGVQVYAGTHRRRQVFDWDIAVADAIAKRQKAEAWVRANIKASQADELYKEADDNFKKWRDTLLPAMRDEATNSCRSSVIGNDALKAQVCENNKNAVHYTETCNKTEYVDNVKTVTLDTNENAPCMPRIQAKRDRALADKNSADGNRDAAYSAYLEQKSPVFTYPSYSSYPSLTGAPSNYFPSFPSSGTVSWFQLAMIEDGETPSGNTAYRWKDRQNNGGRPYYRPGENSLLARNTDVHVFDCFFLPDSQTGTLCERYPYSRAYSDFLSAKEASDEAERAVVHLREQYTVMNARCESLSDRGPDIEGGVQSDLVVGAEALLRLADELGSVGRQPVPASGATP